MPIRFRCAYCNQLMGIARRKAGTVVKCPNCNGQVVVPVEDSVGSLQEPEADLPPAGTQKPHFERSDFDEMLAREGKRSAEPAPVPAPSAAVPHKMPAAYPASFQPVPPKASKPKETAGAALGGQPLDFPQNLPAPAPPPGIVLSPTMATLLSVAIVVALALAFTAGLIIGRLYLQPPSSHDESRNSTPAISAAPLS